MYLITKRLFDIVFSATALLLLLPLFIPIMLLLLFTGEHEVFYRQQRIGYKNQVFRIWKFATMLKNSPNMETGSLTLRNDPRVLPIGKFLRITKINELPQLINVLMGNMSIVGPRPQMEVDFKAYPKHVQEIIYNVKPGITGIGSIIFRDEEEILTDTMLDPKECYVQFIAPYKGKLEIWYQNNQSLYLNLRLIVLTGWIVLFPKSKLHYRLFKSLPPRPHYSMNGEAKGWGKKPSRTPLLTSMDMNALDLENRALLRSERMSQTQLKV